MFVFFFNLSLVNEFSLEMCERSPSPWAETLQCALALCSTWCFLEVRALRAACTGCVTRRQCSEGTAKLGNSCQEVTKFCACTIFAFFPHLSSVTRGAHDALMVILGCQNKKLLCFPNAQSCRSGGAQSTMRTMCIRCSCLSPTSCWAALWHLRRSRRRGSSSCGGSRSSMRGAGRRSCSWTRRGWTGCSMCRYYRQRFSMVSWEESRLPSELYQKVAHHG